MRMGFGIQAEAPATTRGGNNPTQRSDETMISPKSIASDLFDPANLTMRSSYDQFLDGGDRNEQKLNLRLRGFGEYRIELGLLVGGKRFGRSDGVECCKAGGPDGGKVARSQGTFFDQRRFLRERDVSSVVLAPACE